MHKNKSFRRVARMRHALGTSLRKAWCASYGRISSVEIVAHQTVATNDGGLRSKMPMPRNPARKPPICASQAMEASSMLGTKPTSPVTILIANQTARKVITGRSVGAVATGRSGPANTPLRVERAMKKPYRAAAPIMLDMAPEAPTSGACAAGRTM